MDCKRMEGRVDVEKILEAVKEKLKSRESRLDDLARRFQTMKRWLKEWKILLLPPPSSLSEKEIVRRKVIEEDIKKVKRN